LDGSGTFGHECVAEKPLEEKIDPVAKKKNWRSAQSFTTSPDRYTSKVIKLTLECPRESKLLNSFSFSNKVKKQNFERVNHQQLQIKIQNSFKFDKGNWLIPPLS
jgi:hypothetical protein